MKRLIKLFFIIIFSVCLSCEENAFQDLESEVTDASLWFEAKQLINKRKFEEAIYVLTEVSDDYKLQRENLVQYASAYAGFCGLDLIKLVNDSSTLGGATPIAFFMSVFQGQTVDKITACQTAIGIIETNVSEIASDRNDEENIAMMAILMTIIGSGLNELFDPDNDGVLSVGHNGTCSAANISDINAALLGSYLSKMFAAASELSVIDVLSEIKDSVTSGCDELSPTMDFCSAIDPATYTASQIRGVRSLLQEGQIFGMGSCTNSPNSLVNCICP